MLRLGMSIGSFAPALGLPGREEEYSSVAAWMSGLRSKSRTWIQGFPLRGCADCETHFDSVEGPWCGLMQRRSVWCFKPEQSHSLSHWLQAQVVLRLYERPAKITKWLDHTHANAAHIVNTWGELVDRDPTRYRTWIELNNHMGCGFDELLRLLDLYKQPGTNAYHVVYDTLHAAELEPHLSDAQLEQLSPHIALFHWQPSRTPVNGESEIKQVLNGRCTASIEQLQRLRAIGSLNIMPVVMEPSLHHWKALGGWRDWTNPEWVKARLNECAEALQQHLS